MKIQSTMRREFVISGIFAGIWISLIALIALTSPYIAHVVSIGGSGTYGAAAVLAWSANVIFVSVMYVLDTHLTKTNGLLSYWRGAWETLRDDPPYTTISIASTLFIALMIGTIGVDKISALSGYSVSEFDYLLLHVLFALAFSSMLVILVQLNIFDVFRVLTNLSAVNRGKGRKAAWYLYIYMLYAFAFSTILLATLLSPVLGLFMNVFGAVLISLYYYMRTPLSCEVVTSHGLLINYDKLRRQHWGEVSPSRSDESVATILIMFKGDVVGGAQLHFSSGADESLPLEKQSWKLRTKLSDLFFTGKLIAQVSQLVIEDTFQRRGATSEIWRTIYQVATDKGVHYAFATALRKPAKLYKRLGFKEISSVEYPFVKEGTSEHLILLMLDLTDADARAKLESSL